MSKIVKYANWLRFDSSHPYDYVEYFKVQSTIFGIGIPFCYYYKNGSRGKGQKFETHKEAEDFNKTLNFKKCKCTGCECDKK